MFGQVIRKVAILAACSAVMSACTSVPITSYPRLAGLDAETIDLGAVQIAVRMQDDFGIKPDTAVLSVSLKHLETGETFGEDFVLEQSNEPLTPELQQKQKPGYGIYRFKMSPETSAAAAQHRARIIAARNAEPGRQHEGTLSASVGFCMRPRGNPLLDPRMTLFMRPDPAETFFTMVSETKLPLPRNEQNRPEPCES